MQTKLNNKIYIFFTFFVFIIGFQAVTYVSAETLLDFAEPNDSQAESFLLDSPGYWGAFYINNEDWYKIELMPKQSIEISIYFNTGANLVVKLLNENNTVMSIKEGGTGSYYLTFSNPATMAKFYYLNITGIDQSYYDLYINTWISHENDDLAEENDLNITATYLDGFAVSDPLPYYNWDDDWFYIDTFINDSISFNLFSNNNSILTVSAFYMDGSFIQDSVKSVGMDHLELNIENIQDNYVYFKITGDNVGDPYHLAVFKNEDDLFEANNFLLDAVELYADLYHNFKQNNDDWFKFYLYQYDELKVDLFTKNTTMNISLWDYNFVKLAEGTQKDGLLSLNWTNTSDLNDAYYYLLVEGDDTGEFYSLDIRKNGYGFDDFAEQNDLMTQAYELGNSGYMMDLNLFDDDWYIVDVDSETILHMNVYGNDQYTWYVEVYNETGDHLYTLSPDPSNIQFNISNYEPTQTRYYLYVYGNDPFSGMTYSLDYWCNFLQIDDWAEDNDDWYNPATLYGGPSHNLINWDDDWYKIEVPGRHEIIVNMTYNQTMFPSFYMKLWDEGCFYQYMYQDTTYYPMTVKWMNTNETSEYVLLQIYGQNYGYEYDLDILITPITDDWMEENDILSQSHYFSNEEFPIHENGLVSVDEDWFEVSVESQEILTTYLYYDQQSGLYFDVSYFDSSSNPIGSGYYDYDEMAFVLSWENTYSYSKNIFIQVLSDFNGDVYDISILKSYAYDDWFEENDNEASAQNLTLPFYASGLQLYDDDWYVIETQHSDEIDVILSTDWNTDLFIERYDESLNYIGSIPVDQYGLLGFSFTASGNFYYLRVSSSSSQVWYDLQIDVNGETAFIPEDWAEENDNFYSAWELTTGYHQLYLGDDDWFRVNVPSLDRICVELLSTNYNEFLMEIYHANESYYSSAWDASDRLFVDYVNHNSYSANEYVYIRVTGPIGNHYDLNMWFENSGTNQDDGLEENDEYDNAYHLSGSQRLDNLVQFDDDYYSFDVFEGENAEIWVYTPINSPLYLEDIHPSEGYVIRSDYSTDDGVLKLQFYANTDSFFKIAVKGDNLGEWYSIELNIQNDDGDDDTPITPSYDWVSFDSGSWLEYSVNVHFDDDGGPRGEENYNGSVKAEIIEMGLDSSSVWADLQVSWDGIPKEFIPNDQNSLQFHVNGDYNVEDGYFGFVNFFMGKDYFFPASDPHYGTDFRYNMYNNGLSLEVEYIGSQELWFRFDVTLTTDGYLEYLVLESELQDEYGDVYGKARIEFQLGDSQINEPIDDDTSDDDTNDDSSDDDTNSTDDPFANFDFSSIPGFPVEIMGIMSVTIVGMLFIYIRRRLK